MELKQLTLEDTPAWAQLLSTCFDQSIRDMEQLIRWLYCIGTLEAFGMWDGDVLIAQYGCLHRTMSFNHLMMPLGMSMNMAVHPDYRGQGLIKRVSQPVYDNLQNNHVMFGMGFSNAQGVQVDKHSKGYGYEFVGQMQPMIIKTRDFKSPTLKRLDTLPNPFCITPNQSSTKAHFSKDTNHLIHRYLQHPFRRYEYGIWCEDNRICGIVVYKIVRLMGIKSAALLDVFSPQPEELIMRWSTTLHHNHIHLIHLLASPQSHIKQILRTRFLTFDTSFTRNPYYLTVKPLATYFDAELLNFDQWDLVGGDVL